MLQVSSTVDIFPTVVELALGARLPTCPQQSAGVTLCTEGTSLVPLIKAPHAAVKLAAFSVYVTST